MVNFLKDIASAFIIFCSCIGGAFIFFTIPKEETVSGEDPSPQNPSQKILAKKSINKKARIIIIIVLFILAIFFAVFNQFTTYDLIGNYHTTDEFTVFPSYAIDKDIAKAVNAFLPNYNGYATNKIILSNKDNQDVTIHKINVVVDKYSNIDLPFFRFNTGGIVQNIEYYTFYGSVYGKEDEYTLVYIGKADKTGIPQNYEPIKAKKGEETVIPRIAFLSSGLYTIHYIIDYSIDGQSKLLTMPKQTFYIPDIAEIPEICELGIDARKWEEITHHSYKELKESVNTNKKLKDDLYKILLDEKYIEDVYSKLTLWEPSLGGSAFCAPPPDDEDDEENDLTEKKTPAISLEAYPEEQTCHLSWDVTLEAKEYIIKRSVNHGRFQKLCVVFENDYIDKDVSYGNEYWYVIETVLSNGDTIKSNIDPVELHYGVIPEFFDTYTKVEEQWARIQKIQDPNEKVSVFSAPYDDKKTVSLDKVRPSADINKNYVKAYFAENGFILVELPLREKDTDVDSTKKKMIYVRENACDIKPDFSSFPNHKEIKGIVIDEGVIPYFGPGTGYETDWNHKVSKDTEISILYRQDDYYYAQYTVADDMVRMWLPARCVKLLIDQE